MEARPTHRVFYKPCICVQKCTYLYLYMHTYTCMYVYIYMYICVRAYCVSRNGETRYINRKICIDVCIYTYMHVWMHVCTFWLKGTCAPIIYIHTQVLA